MKNYISSLDKGIKQMLFASLMFAFMGAFAKLSSEFMPPIEVVFFRNVFGVLFILFSLYQRPFTHKGGKKNLLFFRGFIGFIALMAFFYNIAHISLADAMTFTKTAPIFTAIFAWIFLHEKLPISVWIAIFIGFIGIILITKPSGVMLEKTDILGIFSGVGAALAYTSVRELKKYYDTRAIVFSFMFIGTFFPLILMGISSYITADFFDFMLGEFIFPEGVVWLYVILMGTFATLAQIYMTKAYGENKAGIIGAVSYSNIIFSVAIGLFMGDAFPEILTIMGIVLIVFAGIMVSRAK